MRFDKAFELDRATAENWSGRHPLSSIKIEKNGILGGEHVAIATTGKMLAVVPVQQVGEGEERLIPGKAWKLGRGAPKTDEGCMNVNGSALVATKNGTVDVPLGLDCQGEFPDWQVIADQVNAVHKTDILKLSINTRFLADLARAIGSEHGEVTLHIDTSEKGLLEQNSGRQVAGPIKVTDGVAFGVIMPLA